MSDINQFEEKIEQFNHFVQEQEKFNSETVETMGSIEKTLSVMQKTGDQLKEKIEALVQTLGNLDSSAELSASQSKEKKENDADNQLKEGQTYLLDIHLQGKKKGTIEEFKDQLNQSISAAARQSDMSYPLDLVAKEAKYFLEKADVKLKNGIPTLTLERFPVEYKKQSALFLGFLEKGSHAIKAKGSVRLLEEKEGIQTVTYKKEIALPEQKKPKIRKETEQQDTTKVQGENRTTTENVIPDQGEREENKTNVKETKQVGHGLDPISGMAMGMASGISKGVSSLKSGLKKGKQTEQIDHLEQFIKNRMQLKGHVATYKKAHAAKDKVLIEASRAEILKGVSDLKTGMEELIPAVQKKQTSKKMLRKEMDNFAQELRSVTRLSDRFNDKSLASKVAPQLEMIKEMAKRIQQFITKKFSLKKRA